MVRGEELMIISDKLSSVHQGPFRHTTSGVGTLIVLQALCEFARLGYLEDKKIISLGLDDILHRCVKYGEMNGKWIVPSDQNGTPNAWNQHLR